MTEETSHPSYREALKLDQSFMPSSDRFDLGAVIASLAAEDPRAGDLSASLRARGASDAQVLRALLTIRQPRPLSESVADPIDAHLASQAAAAEVVGASKLPSLSHAPGGTTLSLWRGDITRLAVDAIVNACNAELLGCFTPFHACIDNAIHAAAGPQLRQDCGWLMDQQPDPEPTGRAKITRGYHLPSSFVLHTVGPIVTGVVEDHHSTELASCYTAGLELAADFGRIDSIAFCGISTGVYGFPKEPAAEVALDAVSRWLAENPGRIDQVVFNVFTAEEHRVYRSALARRGWQ